jgi:hypothetical protein
MAQGAVYRKFAPAAVESPQSSRSYLADRSGAQKKTGKFKGVRSDKAAHRSARKTRRSRAGFYDGDFTAGFEDDAFGPAQILDTLLAQRLHQVAFGNHVPLTLL